MALSQARFFLFLLVAGAYLLVLPLGWIAGIAVDYASVATFLKMIALPVAAAVLYAAFRGMEPMRVALEAMLAGLLLTVPVGLSTYIAIGADFPLADAQLIGMDAALGFDWHSFIGFVDARPWLAATLGLAYRSFGLQLLVVPVLLAVCGRHLRSYALVMGYGVVCLVSSAVSLWYPALGTYSVYALAPRSLASIDPYFGYAFLDEFHAVRDDPNFVFSLSRMAGILTFPSVHAAVAVLCAWAMWDIRPLRHAFLLLNVLMAISAVSHANHYLVDIVAGLGVAGAAIAAVGALLGLARPSRQEAGAGLAARGH